MYKKSEWWISMIYCIEYYVIFCRSFITDLVVLLHFIYMEFYESVTNNSLSSYL